MQEALLQVLLSSMAEADSSVDLAASAWRMSELSAQREQRRAAATLQASVGQAMVERRDAVAAEKGRTLTACTQTRVALLALEDAEASVEEWQAGLVAPSMYLP